MAQKIFRILPALCITASFVAGCAGQRPNGEEIFLTGRNAAGLAIESDLDRSELADPSMQIACATCHGDDRAGRSHPIPALGPFTAPAITPADLAAPTERRPAYTRATLRAAITEGRNPAGKGLHYPMPRWNIADPDLADLVAWLLPDAER